MYAAISADIVSSTSLSKEYMMELNESIKKCLSRLETVYNGFWGRIVKGDSIECILSPEDALEVALILKTWIKAFYSSNMSNAEDFRLYGIRIAIGIGDMKTIDKDLDMMDGEAIYRSGRALNELKGHSKYSCAISMPNLEYNASLQVILNLINQLLSTKHITPRKCYVLCERLFTSNTKQTAENLKISVSGVNFTLKELGWSSIQEAIIYYRNSILKL